MCLAVPSKIISVNGPEAEVEFGGVRKKANLSFMPGVKVGDYVLLHAGFAIEKVDPQKAREIISIWEDLQ